MAATGATTFEKVERIVSDEYQDEGPGAAALLKLRLVTFKEELQSLLRKACSAEFLPEAAGRARVSGRDAAFAG